jgi:hypothetical protein
VELVILVAIMLLGVALYGGISLRERPAGPLQTVELHFGTDLASDTVQAMLASVAGLRSNAMVSLDAVADEHGIRHFLHAPQQTVDTLRSQWRGVLPSLRMVPANVSPMDWNAGALLRLSGSRPVLRGGGGDEESAAALLGAMQPLARGERVLIRWYLGAGSHPPHPPLPPLAPPRGAHRAETNLAHLLLHESTPRADHLRQLRAKYAGPLLSGVAVVAVVAGHPKRGAHLLSRVASAARSRGGAYGQIVSRRRGSRRISHLLNRPALRRPDLYSPPELIALLPLPIGAPQLPGLTLGTAPLLMPSSRIPSTGRVLAVSTWPGLERPLAQPVAGGLSHTIVCGPTGTGKSSYVGNLIAQDLRAGRGLLLIDGKGDLAEDTCARIPEGTDDVIVLDCGRNGPVPGVRLFGRGADLELTADLLLSIFADLFSDSWGPYSARWLRAGLLLLAHDSDAGIADFPFIFAADSSYRQRLLGRVQDPLLKATFAAFESMGQAERAHQLAAPLQKTEELTGRKIIRGVLGQTRPALDMHDVLRTGKVVIVSLAPAKVGSISARLIGALVTFKFFEAVQARAALAPERRRPFFAYIDEPGVFKATPVPIDSLYELARGLGVGVTLGVQSLAQLPADLRGAATSNSSTLVAFRQNAEDARLLSRELPGVDAEGLQNLGQFECLMRIGLGPGDVAPPVSARTLPLPPAISDPEAVRRASAARYGVDPAEVDAALRARHNEPKDEPETPVGRLRGER